MSSYTRSRSPELGEILLRNVLQQRFAEEASEKRKPRKPQISCSKKKKSLCRSPCEWYPKIGCRKENYVARKRRIGPRTPKVAKPKRISMNAIYNFYRSYHPDSYLSSNAKKYLYDTAEKLSDVEELLPVIQRAWKNARSQKRITVRLSDFD